MKLIREPQRCGSFFIARKDDGMEIKEIIRSYLNCKNDRDKTLLYKKFFKSDLYIPYKEKISVCSKALEQYGSDALFFNIHWMIILLNLYTDIQTTGDDVADFDELQKCGALSSILGYIPEDETKQYEFIFEVIQGEQL